MIYIELDDKWWKKESYKFCKFPKAFLMNPEYKNLSHSSMVFYAALIDRMSLSDRNDWRDEDGQIFILYSNKELCKTMNCSHETVTKKLRELEQFGLLKRKKRGQGKADMLYVLEPCEACDSFALQNAENKKSEMQENSTVEFKRMASNKTDSNNTDLNKTDLSISRCDEDGIRNYIKENISYEVLSERDIDTGELDGIVNLMTDICCSTSSTIRINGSDYPREMVVARFLKLNMHHIEYVMESLRRTTADIRNIRAYLLSALFNAPTTIDNYWQQRVLHDMPQLALN